MNNMASIYIDPARVGGAGFAADLEAYAAWMKAAPPAAPGGEVLLPGEVERRTAARRRAAGIPLDGTTRGQLQTEAGRLGVAELQT